MTHLSSDGLSLVSEVTLDLQLLRELSILVKCQLRCCRERCIVSSTCVCSNGWSISSTDKDNGIVLDHMFQVIIS